MAILILSATAYGASLTSPSWLQVNLSFMPFSYYDYNHAAASYNFTQNNISGCPSRASVRSCFQTILHNMRSEEVSGVRIFVTFCDATSLAFSGCGGTWQQISFTPGLPGTPSFIFMYGSDGVSGGVTAFFQDLESAGIQNVTLTFGSTPSSGKTVPKSQVTNPTGTLCTDTPDPVWFRDLEPYGLEPTCAPPSSTCTPGPGNPVGYDQPNSDGYNCSPVNPNFIGWNNLFTVINAMLQAAKGRVNVYELEIAQELNMVVFTSQLRFIDDNSSPQSAGLQTGQYVDVLTDLRNLMTANGFPAGNVTHSAGWWEATAASPYWNCANIYQDYSRNFSLDALAQAIGGGYIGLNADATGEDGLWCGGTSFAAMWPVPLYHTQPTVVDAHIYPAIEINGASDAEIQQIANIDYSDLYHYLIAAGYNTTKPGNANVTIGETYGGKLSPLNLGTVQNPNYCWSGGFLVSVSSPTDNVAGFNASTLTGYNVYFRPWMELEDPAGQCWPYGSGPGTSTSYQDVNYNNGGPYTPSNH